MAGQTVIIADYSYPLPVLRELAAVADSLVVIDHHKTAAPYLIGRPEFETHFDLNKSGAVLAWEFAFPDEPVPELFRYIQDGDLWHWQLPQSREVAAALASYPFEFETWRDLTVDRLRREGVSILRYQNQQIARIRERVGIEEFAGYHVPVLNTSVWQSDLGNLLAQGRPFAVLWYETAEERVYSLRSTDQGVDVGALAQAFGGGGHRNAAGFRLPKPPGPAIPPPPRDSGG